MDKYDSIDQNYWPYPLRSLSEEDPIASKHVIVADISKPWGGRSIRNQFTALAPTELVSEIINHPSGIGVEITTTGPHPSSYNGSFKYVPKFTIWWGNSA